MNNHQAGQLVNRVLNPTNSRYNMLTQEQQRDTILEQLDGEIADCKRQEWANEPRRRAYIRARAKRDGVYKLATKRTAYRRIIYDKTSHGREHQLHATKGWRNFMVLR